MAGIYLYINAALYLVFAAWCTLSMTATSRNLGYGLFAGHENAAHGSLVVLICDFPI